MMMTSSRICQKNPALMSLAIQPQQARTCGKILIAPAAPLPHTSRDFVPWRFLDAGRHSAWKGSSCRRPKTLYGAYWRQGESGGAVESFCHVTGLHLRHGQPLARLRRAVKPQSRLRRAEGAGLDGECAVRAIIICRRNVQKSFGAVRGTVDCYCGELSFHRHE